jgi:hypothetical protein
MFTRLRLLVAPIITEIAGSTTARGPPQFIGADHRRIL